MSALGFKYYNGKIARDSLIAKGWYIHGDSKDTACIATNLVEFNEPQIGFVIYPNPSRGKVYVELNKSFENENLLIYNKLGHVVKEERVVKGKNQINLSELPEGIYLLKYGNISKKLLLNK